MDTLTQIPLKFRTKDAAEKMLDKILTVLQTFREAEEVLEPGFYYSVPSKIGRAHV